MSQQVKNAFAEAKLSHFNIVLLSEIQKHRPDNAPLEQLIDQMRNRAQLSEIRSLVNQAHILGHAYMCLVWLREVVMASSGPKKGGSQHAFVDKQVLPGVQRRFDFSGIKKLSGPRDLSDPGQMLILIRNGLSHARVEITETTFVISDQNVQRKETVPTSVELAWPTLGKLCDAFLFAVSDYLFPGATGDAK